MNGVRMALLRGATWLRRNSERYLMADAQAQMARRYLGREGPVGVDNAFWRRVFVPVYRLLPWQLRNAVLRAMPGSHRRFAVRPPPQRAA
jgi:hypothetical protein